MIHGIHHIDFVVSDLDAAVERYRLLLDREPLPRESLPHRGVDLQRFDVAGTWIILVQPTHPSSPVADFLEQHGEGFFHLAYRTDAIASEAERLSAAGFSFPSPARQGVDGWKLLDLKPEELGGVLSQLIEEATERP